jgi:hypothetical protein
MPKMYKKPINTDNSKRLRRLQYRIFDSPQAKDFPSPCGQIPLCKRKSRLPKKTRQGTPPSLLAWPLPSRMLKASIWSGLVASMALRLQNLTLIAAAGGCSTVFVRKAFFAREERILV